jgi:hypothetical protein
MRVGACEGFAYNSVKLVLLANVNRYEVDSSSFFLSDKALVLFKILPRPQSDFPFFYTHIHVCSLWFAPLITTQNSVISRILPETEEL